MRWFLEELGVVGSITVDPVSLESGCSFANKIKGYCGSSSLRALVQVFT